MYTTRGYITSAAVMPSVAAVRLLQAGCGRVPAALAGDERTNDERREREGGDEGAECNSRREPRLEPPVQPEQEWHRQDEPDRAEQNLPARAGEQRSARERTDVVEHMRKYPRSGAQPATTTLQTRSRSELRERETAARGRCAIMVICAPPSCGSIVGGVGRSAIGSSDGYEL